MTRKITDAEKELWRQATRDVKNPGGEIDDFLSAAGKVKIRITPVEEIFPPQKTSRKAAKELVPGKVNAMDGGSFRKLFQGRQKIEARLDLHGKWLNEAQIAMRDFIELSHAGGKRCVLIITGKGGITGQGKIRAEFPKWINDPDIRRHVLSFTPARPEHGGGGAFYVYLRK